jgi:hypothetical protein
MSQQDIPGRTNPGVAASRSTSVVAGAIARRGTASEILRLVLILFSSNPWWA